VSTAFAALTGLEPGDGYSITEPDSPPDAPPVFYMLVGLPLADDSVGTVSKLPVKVKGARSVMFFTVGPQDEGSPARRTVLVHNTWTGTRANVTVHTSQAIAPLERAFELKGLDGTETYRVTLASVGQGARTRGQDGGTLRKVACARQSSKEAHFGEADPNEFLREQQFLLVEGAFVEVRGASALRCGFIDDDPADNQGEMELRITQQAKGRGGVASAGGVSKGGGDSGAADKLYRDGVALIRQQQFAEAMAVLSKCITVDPSHAQCHLMLGTVMARRNHHAEGAKYYREFLRLAPNDPKAPMVKKLLADYERTVR
jgi:serine/threonine-protein kinase